MREKKDKTNNIGKNIEEIKQNSRRNTRNGKMKQGMETPRRKHTQIYILLKLTHFLFYITAQSESIVFL